MAVKHAGKSQANQKSVEAILDILNLTTSIYIILILTFMPFYFTQGYGRIGTNKYEFFHGVTIAVGAVFLLILSVFLIFCIYMKLEDAKRKKDMSVKAVLGSIKNDMSVTDWFALGYGVALLLSYLHTDYRTSTAYGDAWTGSNGWYMGFSSQMLFLAVYFSISRFWKPQKWIWLAGGAASFVVFLLGYCNRFGIYPIKMEYAQPSFISTIGNINWFCGYAVTIFFGILYYGWIDVEKSWLQKVLIIYCIVGFGALTVQGSNSGLLTLIVLLVVFYLMSMRQGERMQRFWLLMIMLGAVCSATVLIRRIFPDSFQLKDGLTDLFTYSVIPVVILTVSILMYFLVNSLNKAGKYPEKFFCRIGKIGVVVGILLFILVITGILINTLVPGSLGSMSEISFFTFDKHWGSGRGATYMAGIQTWLDQDWLGRLTGVGPDCMAMYIHSGNNQEILSMVQSIWGQSTMLTNAHCEWLTVMINVGVLGLIGFAGMITSAVIRFCKAGKSNVMAAACGISILAYTVNNMVSFQQAMATTTMFVILGIGEAYMRGQKRK